MNAISLIRRAFGLISPRERLEMAYPELRILRTVEDRQRRSHKSVKDIQKKRRIAVHVRLKKEVGK